MDLTIPLLRPDDLLTLVVEATNMRLDTSDPRNPRLVRVSGAQPALLTFRFPPQSIAECAYFETAPPPSPPFRPLPFNPPPSNPALPVPPTPGTESPAPPGSVDVRMSGESRLVFQVPDSLSGIPYTIEGLLDWSRLIPVLPPAALVPPGARQAPGQDSPAIAEPGPAQTAIELPYRLILAPNVSPHEMPTWLHAAGPVDHADRIELWHTRLGSLSTRPGGATAEATPGRPLPVRVIWSLDFVPNGPPPDRAGDDKPFRSSTSASDRDQIVILSAGFSGYTLTTPDLVEQPYVPQPVEADRLFLSALGGWLRSRGAWPYPVTYIYLAPARPAAAAALAATIPAPAPVATVVSKVAALDLIEWDHDAAQGRDQYVRIVYEGFLHPFGHRVSLVKITERKVLAPNGTDGNPADSPVAYLRQRMYITVREREKTYTAEPYQFAGREMPLATQVRVDISVTPDIDAPGPGNQVGQESFWIELGQAPYLFPMVGQDAAGQDVNFLAPVIFVSLREPDISVVTQAYTQDNDRRRCVVRGRQLAYADPAAGDTVLKTTSLYFTAEPIPTASGQPPQPPYIRAPFLPSLDAAAVTIPALSALIGQNTPVVISLYTAYLEHGLDAHAGVFASVVGDPTPTTFIADKSGGFAQPNIRVSALSARKGLVSGAADDAASGIMRPSAYFGASDARLFGAISLGDLVHQVAGVADAAQNAPEIRTHALPSRRHPEQVVTVITWEPQLADNPPAGSGVSIVFNADGQASALSLQVRLEKQLNGTPPVSAAHGKLVHFEVTISGVISLKIDEITFDSSNGAKSTVALQLARQHPVQFVGALQFIQTLADILPPGLFGGSGPSITLTPSALRVTYTIGLPPIPCGVFSLEHIAIMAGLDLPYLDGKPAVEFAFAARNRPFLVTVEIFGGGGFVHVVLDAQGIRMVEGAIEFGANFSLDLGVASGAVHAMAGIYFKLQNNLTVLTGFIDIGGEVSVLGIVSISIDLNISLTWQQSPSGNVIEGRATLTVSVHVLFFSASVQLSVERSFSAGSGDPRVYQQISAPQWALYAGAFG